jgi:hypothetical protein
MVVRLIDPDYRLSLTQDTDFFFFFIEELKIPDLSTAKQLTAKSSNVPGSVGLVMPMNYDLNLAIEKGLCGEDGFGKKYLYMQALYRKALENLLLESTNLKEFDDRLSSSELVFVPVPEKEQSFYQLYSTWDLQFVYLCSNIPLERLDEDDLAILDFLIKGGKVDISSELTTLVRRTFSDVLIANPNLDDDVLCGYGYSGNISPNRSIVLEISNYDFDENGNFRDISTNEARSNFMKKLAEEMQNTLSEQLGHRVIVQVGF